MSELNVIADLLRAAIKQRQQLTIGSAQFFAAKGRAALYTTASGTIRAIATDDCTGDCLLAKIEGTWYAIPTNRQRQIIRSNIDRMVRNRIKAIGAASNIAIFKSLYGYKDITRHNAWFASNDKIEIATVATMEAARLTAGNKSLNPKSADANGFPMYENEYPYPLPTVREHGYSANRTRSTVICRLTQFDLTALKTAMDAISPPYRYVYYGIAPQPTYLKHEAYNPFDINYQPVTSNPANLPFGISIVSSLALEPEPIVIPTTIDSTPTNELGTNFWLPEDFDRSYHREPEIKLGIRNAINNDFWSLQVTGEPDWHPAYGISANRAATNGYAFEAMSHHVIRLDLEDPSASGWVANQSASNPFYYLPYPDNRRPYRVGINTTIAHRFVPDDPNPNPDQNVFEALYYG